MRLRRLLGGLGVSGWLAGCAAAPSHVDAPIVIAANAKRLPTRVRRLTNLEYERTVSQLLGYSVEVARRLPPDVRQEGYTENVAQAVPATWAARLDDLARELAHEALGKAHERLVPSRKAERSAADYREAARALARRAFRRPLSEEEELAFDAAIADGLEPRARFEAVLAALLQSPSLLYVSELGPVGAPLGSRVRLSDYEIASLLAYTVRGGPPDEELLDAAENGWLREPAGRESQARRLLSESATRYHFRRFVLEWLEVDGLEATAKNPEKYPDYDRLRPLMLAETTNFIDEVMVHDGASITSLLDAGFASVEPTMARFYGLSTYGPRASLGRTGRRGLLQQASFLAAHAHEDVSSPVKRGDFVLRKLLCERMPRPGEIGIDIVMPLPSTTITTRERFAKHAENGQCNACHSEMDAVGFSFEAFDAMGRSRSTEFGLPVDTSGRAELANEIHEFSDSAELTFALARSPVVSECFARQSFRYFSAQSDAEVEKTYLTGWRGLEPAKRASLLEALVAFVKSDLFVEREVTQ